MIKVRKTIYPEKKYLTFNEWVSNIEKNKEGNIFCFQSPVVREKYINFFVNSKMNKN